MKKFIILSLLLSSTISFSMLRNTSKNLIHRIFIKNEITTTKNKFFEKTFERQTDKSSKLDISSYSFCHPEIMKILKKAHERGVNIQLFLGNDDYSCAENSDPYKEEFKKLGIKMKEFWHLNPRNQGCNCCFTTPQGKTLLSAAANISCAGLMKENCRFTNDPKFVSEFLERFNRHWNLTRN